MQKYKLFWYITLGVGLSSLLFSIIYFLNAILLHIAGADSIAIIGGADGSTALFLTEKLLFRTRFPIVSPFILGPTLIAMATFSLVFRKTVCKHCKIKTTLLALGISFACSVGYIGLANWYSIVIFRELSRHPFLYPMSIAMSLFALITFVILIVWYCVARKSTFSIPGLLIDISTALITFPWFSLLCYGVMNIF